MRWGLGVCILVVACGDNRAAPPDARPDTVVDTPIDTPADALCPSNCDDGDACTTDACTLTGCIHVDTSACATPFCDLATSCGWQDTDHDGLSDSWETHGYVDINCNGVDDGAPTDVPLPGANPAVPDIYIRYDFMMKSGTGAHDHAPPAAALAQVIAAFAAHGIAVHFSLGSAITEHEVVTLDPNPNAACAGNDAISTAALRPTQLGPLAVAYHYLVFGHRATCPDASHCVACPSGTPSDPGATGIADQAGDDVIVAFGNFVDASQPIGIELWASTIMHELGHNLDLRHGGSDDVNYKPNYVSVMNYADQLNGIPVGDAPGSSNFLTCATDADCGPPSLTVGRCATANACHCTDDLTAILGVELCYRVDYSDATLPSLNELSPSAGTGGLDESVGVASTATDDDIIFYWASPGPVQLTGAANGAAIDWNNDTAIGSHVQADINNDGTYTLLASQNDWAIANNAFTHLTLAFQCTPGAGPSAVPAPNEPARRHTATRFPKGARVAPTARKF